MTCVQSQDELLRPAEAARLLNVTPRCLQDWRLKGIGPRFIRMTPKLVQYRRSELEKFIEESAALAERVCGLRTAPAGRDSKHQAERTLAKPKAERAKESAKRRRPSLRGAAKRPHSERSERFKIKTEQTSPQGGRRRVREARPK